MTTFCRRLFVVLGVVVIGAGCNVLSLPFFIFGPEPKFPPAYHPIAKEGDNEEVKVVILSYMGLGTNTDLLHADRDITRRFASRLREQCEYNGENIKVINPLKVEEYKRENPDWHYQHLDLESVGKRFGADYVIYLEINALSLYQPGTANTFYRGQANITVSLVDVNNPDDFLVSPKDLAFSYPPEAQGGNRLVDMDTPPQNFRAEFFKALARELSWQFTSHPTREHYKHP